MARVDIMNVKIALACHWKHVIPFCLSSGTCRQAGICLGISVIRMQRFYQACHNSPAVEQYAIIAPPSTVSSRNYLLFYRKPLSGPFYVEQSCCFSLFATFFDDNSVLFYRPSAFCPLAVDGSIKILLSSTIPDCFCLFFYRPIFM